MTIDVTSSSGYQDSKTISLLEKFGEYSQYLLPAATAIGAAVTGNMSVIAGMAVCSIAQKISLVKLKSLFPRERPRPYYFGKISKMDHQSFPSGHSAGAFLSFGLCMKLYGFAPQTILALGAASLVGASRVLCKKHWTTDVIAGALIGTSFGYLSGCF